jgi:hypothetical protein
MWRGAILYNIREAKRIEEQPSRNYSSCVKIYELAGVSLYIPLVLVTFLRYIVTPYPNWGRFNHYAHFDFYCISNYTAFHTLNILKYVKKIKNGINSFFCCIVK